MRILHKRRIRIFFIGASPPSATFPSIDVAEAATLLNLIAVVGIVGSAIGIAWPSWILIQWAVSSNTTTSNKELAYWNWLKIVLLREGIATISHRSRANLQWANILRYVLLRDNILCNLT